MKIFCASLYILFVFCKGKKININSNKSFLRTSSGIPNYLVPSDSTEFNQLKKFGTNRQILHAEYKIAKIASAFTYDQF